MEETANSIAIVLIGPKHSGKTSAGKALAALLKGKFKDLDAVIGERTGKSPRELYREGPLVFRKAEAEALEALFGDVPSRRIIATGGGLADNCEALSLLQKLKPPPFLVYLEVPAETAWRRIELAAAKSGEFPPFLKTANPKETHRELHERRAIVYRELAGLSVRGEGKTPEELAEEILNRLNLLQN
ncbi:MAG: shikimate kinase [Treponema sp.]|jgi:shikimate kinase|nr:shikimate kinase [Treponema sp.]